MAPRTGGRRQHGFTMIELLVTIGVIMLLMGLIIPLGTMLAQSSHKVHATAMVAALHAALRTYSAEDSSRRFPPTEADQLVRASGNPAAQRMLDLLVPDYINAGIETLIPDPVGSSGRLLMDPWDRPYRYQVDAVADATVARPDPARADWNARGLQPFAYVWSLGRPRQGGSGDASDPDAVPGGNAPWIYVSTTPEAP